MKKITTLFTFLTIWCAGAGSLKGKTIDIYVAPRGRDTATGAFDSPLLTLTEAQKKARVYQSESSEKLEIKILLREGNYPFLQTLNFAAEDGGQGDNQVTYQSYPGEWAIITSEKKITLSAVNSKLWSGAITDPIGNFYVNGKLCQSAGYQKGIPLKYTWSPDCKKGVNPENPTCTVEGLMQSIEGLEEARLLWIDDWRVSRLPIQQKKTSNSDITKAEFSPDKKSIYESFVAHGLRQAPKFSKYSTLENAFPLISDGEWYENIAHQKIIYQPRTTEVLEATHFSTPTLPTLIAVTGSREKPVRNLHFKNLRFAFASSEPLASETYIPYQAGLYWLSAPPSKISYDERTSAKYVKTISSAVRLVDCRNVSLEGNIFDQLSGIALSVSGVSANVSITGNAFLNIGAEAITCGEPYHPAIPGNSPPVSHLNIRNNLIRHVGQNFPGSPAITVFYASDTDISANDIAEIPYTGISLGWGWQDRPDYTKCANNRVERNRIVDFMQITRDGGGIYTLGPQPNSVCMGNYIANGTSTGVFGAIYFDQGSSGFINHNNVCENIFQWLNLHKATGIQSRDNYVTNIRSDNQGTDCKIEDTHKLTDPWPTEARLIKELAGIKKKDLTTNPTFLYATTLKN